MLPQLIKIIPPILLMNILLFTGMFFISGQIFSGKLGGFYASSGFFLRTAIASVTVFALANFIGGFMMAKFTPSVVAPALIACYVLMQIVFTIAVIGYRPSFLIVPATLIVMAGCVWVSVLLGAKS